MSLPNTFANQFNSVDLKKLDENFTYLESLAVGAAVGSVSFFAGTTVPTGWLKCNGAALSRLLYTSLFAQIGYTFGGSGDTFNLPDLRGEFIRGYDDGRGIDSGRTFGSFQADDLKSHTHTYTRYASLLVQTGSNTPCWSGTSTIDTGATGGTETRPRNLALMPCIKYS